MKLSRPTSLLAAGAAATLLFAACGDDDTGAGGVDIDGAWARTSPMAASAGAAYFDITSEETSSIVSVSVPSDIAATSELHETSVADMSDDEMSDMDDDMSDDEMSDMDMEDGEHMGDMPMQMREVEAIALPAGETVSLEPGGLHVMMLDLVDPLETGETFEIVLTLENGDEVPVEVEVRDEAP